MRHTPRFVAAIVAVAAFAGVGIASASSSVRPQVLPTASDIRLPANVAENVYVGNVIVWPTVPATTTTISATTTTVRPTTTTVAPTTTVPVTTTTVAATTTTAPPTTVVMPTTTTSPATTTTAVAGAGFSQAFTGNLGLDTFNYGVVFRNALIGGGAPQTTPWLADHDMSMPCGDPTTHRVVHPDQVNEVFFTCRDHMMTSLGDGLNGEGQADDYGIAYFTPKQTFAAVNKACVDFNLTDELNREWVQIDIVPTTSSNLEVPDWLTPSPAGDTTQGYTAAGGVHVGYNVFGSHKLAINDSSDWQEQRGSTDIATRYTTCVINNHDGTATVTQNRPSGPVSFTAPAVWPTGNVKVVFSQHSYHPNKDGIPITHTIHWDNVNIS